MAISSYTGRRNGAIQTSVTDMMSAALEGHLFSPADFNLTDSLASSETSSDGLICGMGCVLVPVIGNIAPGGINSASVRTPKAGDTAASFAGLVVRTQHVQTNANGVACIDENMMATVLRNTRSGGRAWVRSYRGNPVRGGNVFMVVNSTAPETLPNGAFVTAAVASDAIELPGIVWVSDAVEGELTTIEMRG